MKKTSVLFSAVARSSGFRQIRKKGVFVSLRNGVFSILVGVVLASPMTVYGLVNILKLDISPALTAQDASWLTGGIAEANVRDTMSFEGFERGLFQDSMESAVGNYVPAKASVLLANAAVQRLFISASSSLFGWPCYPTYYGSTKLYSPAHVALAEMPMLDETKVVASDVFEKGTRRFGAALAELAKKYPEKNFCVVVADRTSTSSVNPAFSLVSNRLSTDECANFLQRQVTALDNVSVVAKTYDDTEEYYGFFYPTDHHWNGYGALDAARGVVSAGMLGDIEDPVSAIDFGELFFNGTLSRRGLLCLNRPPIIEPVFDVRSMSVEEGASSYFKYLFAVNGSNELEHQELRAEYNFYGEWYGGDRSVRISNAAGGEKSKALLICDSYGDAFRWAIAGQYKELYCEMQLKKASYTASDLESWISGYDCEDVYLVAWAGNFAHMKDE
ncbi:hypothetical protein [Adlercreutzia shanghongiae]|uniref:AlgX/AlgJ SGNH hydrolase-like domain-containing protein n=1 Tax=Adlercreutzia shanghongiae TaxID=3111773 RepID=A0ABU6J0A2_9ACTN|nr:hypothetical protein [Adlercreutzia sp. R22]MEC4295532.1 hypothetical protein [Adlercreutzia sp. R22]